MNDLPSYLPGSCPNCDRVRLMPAYDRDERLIGIECEKCRLAWPLNEATGTYIAPGEGAPWEERRANDPFEGLGGPRNV